MNYIYDILLNFNKELYDFFDWDINDEIYHIRKIPLIKIDAKDLDNIKNNTIEVNGDFLEYIKNKTEIFTSRHVKNLEYACIFTDGAENIGVKFNSNGRNIEMSRMLVDEDGEVTEVSERINETKIEYKIIFKNKINNFKTRKELEIEKYIRSELKKLNNANNIDKLKYLYYECFDEKENDRKAIIERISKSLNNNWDDFYLKIYNFFKLTSINK